MAKKQQNSSGYNELKKAVDDGRIGSLYIFHGEERFLLERSLADIRERLCPDGLDGFNYRRYEGESVTPAELDDAVNTLPFNAERTLVEVFDYDVFGNDRGSDDDESGSGDGDDGGSDDNSGGTVRKDRRLPGDIEKEKLLEIFSDLPDYVCLIFIYDTLAFKPNRSRRINKDILGKTDVIEFAIQDSHLLVKWITAHFNHEGKSINSSDAEYLAFITGGNMSALLGEIGKIIAYTTGDDVARAGIDAVTTPIPDAIVYKMTDAIIAGNTGAAMRILDELLRMREPPQKIIFNISLKMRQLLAARVWIENGLDKDSFMDVCGIRRNLSFQAAPLLRTARGMSLSQCRGAVLACSKTALLLNSSSEPEACLVELAAKLAFLS